jgi:hypothetical protein
MGQEEPENGLIRELSGEGKISKIEKILKWRDSAFHAALQKFQDGHDNAETVMRTAEAFGRGLYSQRLKEKTLDGTIKEWLEVTQEDIMRPFGAEFTFTKVSQDVAQTFMNRDPLQQLSKQSTVASLFDYGVLRGLFLSAFPKGELLLKETTSANQLEFIFKTNASVRDRFERERVKRMFTPVKKDDGA